MQFKLLARRGKRGTVRAKRRLLQDPSALGQEGQRPYDSSAHAGSPTWPPLDRAPCHLLNLAQCPCLREALHDTPPPVHPMFLDPLAAYFSVQIG